MHPLTVTPSGRELTAAEHCRQVLPTKTYPKGQTHSVKNIDEKINPPLQMHP